MNSAFKLISFILCVVQFRISSSHRGSIFTLDLLRPSNFHKAHGEQT